MLDGRWNLRKVVSRRIGSKGDAPKHDAAFFRKGDLEYLPNFHEIEMMEGLNKYVFKLSV